MTQDIVFDIMVMMQPLAWLHLVCNTTLQVVQKDVWKIPTENQPPYHCLMS